MLPSLFNDPDTMASFERLRGSYDERTAFLVAAIDGAYRSRVEAGHERSEAYALSVGEIARISAIVMGYSRDEGRAREKAVYERTLREGLDDPVHPHASRFL